MQEETAEIAAIRIEIMKLLRQQLEALDTAEGLTDNKLMECYDRQARVQALREQLQTLAQMKETERTASRKSANVIVMPSTAKDAEHADRMLRVS
jgi:hypothetical protein